MGVDGLFAASSSLERKYLGYQLFLAFLPQIPEELVAFLFTSNFLRCLVNHSASGDRYLNKAAKKAVPHLRECALILALHYSCRLRSKTGYHGWGIQRARRVLDQIRPSL